MSYTSSNNDVVNEYISNLPESVKELFLSIRETILSAQSDLNESIKWKNCLVYATTRNIIQTVVGKDKVSLIFFDGISITDRFGHLAGDGKQTRTMRITALEYDKVALTDYVSQAVAINAAK